MKKLKLEKLKDKHKFYSKFNILTRTFAYLPVCMLLGWASSFLGIGLGLRILFVILACVGWDLTTRFLWSKAKKKADALELAIEEYAETEQGEKEVVLLANIEAVQEILSDKECKIRPTCESLLKKLLDTKYKMANKPKVKCKDPESGKVIFGEVVDDTIEEIDLDDVLYKSAEESGFFNTEEE